MNKAMRMAVTDDLCNACASEKLSADMTLNTGATGLKCTGRLIGASRQLSFGAIQVSHGTLRLPRHARYSDR